jgi:glycosyltransferase involved in cell wall biosynthesis
VKSRSLIIDVSSVPAKPAGAGRYAMALVSSLSQIGPGFKLAAKRSEMGIWKGLSGTDVIISAPDKRPLRIIWEQTKLARQLSLSQVGIYHGIHYTIPRDFAGKTVVTLHDMTMIENPEWHQSVKVKYFSRAINFAIAKADVIIVPSWFTKSKLELHFGKMDKVVPIHHGVDHARFFPSTRGESTNPGNRLVSELPNRFLLHIGTIEPRKNIGNLIGAFDEVAKRDKEIALVLVGQKGWKSDGIYSRIAASPFKSRIRIFGYLSEDDLQAVLASASCVVYPSFAEGFGLPVLEAMAAGIPVVTSRDSVMEEIALEAGWYCDPLDPKEIADKIESAIHGSEQALSKVTLGVARSREFTWEKSALEHLKVYRSLGFELGD